MGTLYYEIQKQLLDGGHYNLSELGVVDVIIDKYRPEAIYHFDWLRPGPIYQRDSTVWSGRNQLVYGTGGYNNSRGQLYD